MRHRWLEVGALEGTCVLLATQNPGDFDYKARDNINTLATRHAKTERAVCSGPCAAQASLDSDTTGMLVEACQPERG